ncbi:MAG: NAD-dependent epimerase/dehydratase family protein [Microthrixaceae bacterium]
MNGRRVVVTGAAGMIGSHLVDALLARGDTVVGVDNLLTGDLSHLAGALGHPDFSLVEADVADGIPVTGEVDAVFHLASPASPRHFIDLPLEILRVGSAGTIHALELARRTGATFLFASSSEVYGEALVHPQSEDDRGNVATVGERACYDEAKRFSEAATDTFRARFGVDTRIVRIFNTYGPRLRPEDGRVVVTFLDLARRGLPLTVHGDGSQTRSYCFVDDLVRGLLVVADSTEQRPVNLGNPAEVTVLELAAAVLEVTGADVPLEFRPRPENDPTRRRPDITRARSLGWQPEVELADGLARTLEWLRATRA